MKAARLHSYGNPSNFTFDEVADPAPGPCEVLIRVIASSVNHIDLFMRQGTLHQMLPLEHPSVLGRDGAGTIVSVGAGVSGFKPGDRVAALFPLNGRGAHAELAVAPVGAVAHLPANVSFEEGATLPLAAVTGRLAVDALQVKRGARVIVSGVAR